MFDHVWVRFVVAGLLFGAYGAVDLISRGTAGRGRPPRVRRPRWSHFIGFASVLFFYEAIVRDGREFQNGAGNQFGVVLAMIAIVLRFAWRNGIASVRYPDLTARMLFYFALPVVIGSPRGFVLFTLFQAAIAIREALQRDEVNSAPPSVPDPARAAAPHRIIPGVW